MRALSSKVAVAAATAKGSVSGIERPSRRDWAFLVLLTGLVVVYSLLPLGTALELAGDEGFELTKGFLCSKGFVLYKQIWCDQPPLYPKLLSWLFLAFGPSILAARLAAAGFGLLLCSVVYQMVRQRSGCWAAVATALFLLASPAVLQMSVSVMVEVPSIATALLSGLLVVQWTKRRHWAWLLASGGVMGLAMEIKVTAMMLAPAIVAEIVVECCSRRGEGAVHPKTQNRKQARMLSGFKAKIDQGMATNGRDDFHVVPNLPRGVGRRGSRPYQVTGFSSAARMSRRVLSGVVCWGAAAGVVFLAIAFVWGRGSLETSWKSHTLALPVPGLGSPGDFRFEPTLLLRHPECLFGAVAGVALLSAGRRWRELVFPVVMFATCFLIHTFHRPWWSHYYLHLAVPLAWLSGLAAGEVLKRASRLFSVGWSASPVLARSQLTVGCVLAGLAFAVSEARLESTIRKIRQLPRAADSPLLARIKQYASQTHWIYSQPVIYPFHARLPVPPELAVVVLKRYWSGQITPTEIVETCRRYKPEQVLLYASRVGSEWQDMLNEYRPVYQDTNYALFVAKDIQER